jgi:hypothetical protein
MGRGNRPVSVKVLPAIGEGIRCDVQNAHDQTTVSWALVSADLKHRSAISGIGWNGWHSPEMLA